MKPSLYRFIILLSVLSMLASCKTTVSLSGATIPPEAKTVSVGFFANNTSLGPPTLSQAFTERMRDVMSRQTRLSLLRNDGDLQFEGYISEYNVAPVAIQSNDQAQQNRLTIAVKVVFFNKFDESKNFDQTFSRFVDFPGTTNLSSEEGRLIEEVNRQLTEDIFNRAFNNW